MIDAAYFDGAGAFCPLLSSISFCTDGATISKSCACGFCACSNSANCSVAHPFGARLRNRQSVKRVAAMHRKGQQLGDVRWQHGQHRPNCAIQDSGKHCLHRHVEQQLPASVLDGDFPSANDMTGRIPRVNARSSFKSQMNVRVERDRAPHK